MSNRPTVVFKYSSASSNIGEAMSVATTGSSGSLQAEVIDIKMDINDDDEDVTYLYNADFERGTYRITEGGTYVVMEDIKLDFNNDLDDPNCVGAYYPGSDQVDMYPGIQSFVYHHICNLFDSVF